MSSPKFLSSRKGKTGGGRGTDENHINRLSGDNSLYNTRQDDGTLQTPAIFPAWQNQALLMVRYLNIFFITFTSVLMQTVCSARLSETYE